jgi:hypothetical protein
MYKFTQRFFHFVAIRIAVIIVHVARILGGDIEKNHAAWFITNKGVQPCLVTGHTPYYGLVRGPHVEK